MNIKIQASILKNTVAGIKARHESQLTLANERLAIIARDIKAHCLGGTDDDWANHNFWSGVKNSLELSTGALADLNAKAEMLDRDINKD